MYPNIDEVFELTLDGSDPNVQPLAIIKKHGYGIYKKWKHTGKIVIGRETRKFKLIDLDFCANWGEIKNKFMKYLNDYPGAVIPESQWLVAFTSNYREYDYNGPIGIADASYTDDVGNANFLCVWHGSLFFVDDVHVSHQKWRWLVEVK